MQEALLNLKIHVPLGAPVIKSGEVGKYPLLAFGDIGDSQSDAYSKKVPLEKAFTIDISVSETASLSYLCLCPV